MKHNKRYLLHFFTLKLLYILALFTAKHAGKRCECFKNDYC